MGTMATTLSKTSEGSVLAWPGSTRRDGDGAAAASNKGHFPSDESALELIWLSLRYITAERARPPKAWHGVIAQLAIQFGDRFKVNRPECSSDHESVSVAQLVPRQLQRDQRTVFVDVGPITPGAVSRDRAAIG